RLPPSSPTRRSSDLHEVHFSPIGCPAQVGGGSLSAQGALAADVSILGAGYPGDKHQWHARADSPPFGLSPCLIQAGHLRETSARSEEHTSELQSREK